MGQKVAVGLSTFMTVLLLLGHVTVSAREIGGDRVTDCMTCAERVNNCVRELSVYARGLEFRMDEVVKQRDLLVQEISAMEEEHSRFLESLSPEEKQKFSQRISIMEQERNRIQIHLREMDRQLEAAELDPWRIGQEVDGIGASVYMWTRQYSLMDY